MLLLSTRNQRSLKFPSDSNSVSINYFTPMNSFFERDLEQLFWDWPIDYHKHFFTHKVTTVTFGLIFLYTQYSDYFVDSYRGADIYKKTVALITPSTHIDSLTMEKNIILNLKEKSFARINMGTF